MRSADEVAALVQQELASFVAVQTRSAAERLLCAPRLVGSTIEQKRWVVLQSDRPGYSIVFSDTEAPNDLPWASTHPGADSPEESAPSLKDAFAQFQSSLALLACFDGLNYDPEAERQKQRETDQAALALPPALLGKRGACHVVAMILSELFPQYSVAGKPGHGGIFDHIVCVSGDWLIDIDGVRPIDLDLVPTALPPVIRPGEQETRPTHFKAYALYPEFISQARNRLAPYIRANLDKYEVPRSP